MKLSICIPTYNRGKLLDNCLHSIASLSSKSSYSFEICISNNCSTDNSEEVIQFYMDHLPIVYHKNSTNVGIARNFLKVVDMAQGEFVWLIGNDDLILPYALVDLFRLFEEHSDVDYFYVNSSHIDLQHITNYPHPFNISNLPKKLKPFSSRNSSSKMKFFDMIDPEVSFDFLAGIFLSVFKRDKWVKNVSVLKRKHLYDSNLFSHVENTFPHLVVFSKAFANSTSYFYKKPLTACITGAREWAPMYPLIHSVRFIEILNIYRENGLPLFQYLKCRNFALKYFIPHIVKMLIHRRESGIQYLMPMKHVISNCLFPNFYLSFFYYTINKLKRFYLSFITKYFF